MIDPRRGGTRTLPAAGPFDDEHELAACRMIRKVADHRRDGSAKDLLEFLRELSCDSDSPIAQNPKQVIEGPLETMR